MPSHHIITSAVGGDEEVRGDEKVKVRRRR
jgi:hypothetical protein